MRPLCSAVLFALAVPAFADDRAALPQRPAEVPVKAAPTFEAADRPSCEAARTQVEQAGGACAQEQALLAKVDCASAEARRQVDVLKLSTACAHRAADWVKADAKQPAPCKAVDPAGTVLGEATAHGSYVHCQAALDPVLLPRCPPELAGKAWTYTIATTFLGKDKRVRGFTLCPKAK